MYVDMVEYSEERHISVVWRSTTEGTRGRESGMAKGETDEYVTHPEIAHKYPNLKYILCVMEIACNMENLWHSVSCYWKVPIKYVIKTPAAISAKIMVFKIVSGNLIISLHVFN
jgi:hypothetical protein